MASPARASAGVVLGLGLLSAAALAQGPPGPAPHPVIEQVRVGLPTGEGVEVGRPRAGAWTPVWVKVKAGKDNAGPKTFSLVIEATDAEDAAYTYATDLPALAAGQDFFAFVYVRGSPNDMKLTLRHADGRALDTRPVRGSQDPIGERDALVVGMGGGLNRLKQSLIPPAPPKGGGPGGFKDKMNPPGGPPGPGKDKIDPDAVEINAEDLQRVAVRSYAAVDSVEQMPDRWFGYDAADVVVLSTENAGFVQALAAPDAAGKRKALAEWVRRGGKLVVAVAANQQLVADLLANMPLPEADKMPLIDCAIEGSDTLPRVTALGTWVGGRPPDLEKVEVAVLKPGAGCQAVVSEAGRPLVVRGSCGLGQVWVVALDFGTRPFSVWPGQRAFLTKLRDEVIPGVYDPAQAARAALAAYDQRPGLGTQVQESIESFPDTPTVSFGWVALFILVYIAVVGPLDYFVLKKLFKRLELTWITFPLTVIVISVAAYFTAYALKGDQQRVHKVDLIELDLHEPNQAYGTSWFAVFSPRIQTYTLGVQPTFVAAAAPEGVKIPPASVAVAPMDRGAGRSGLGGQGLFRRPYAYAADGAGLERVPIPVWSSRAFSARWRCAVAAEKPPVAADLRLSRDPKTPVVTGTITNNLPVDLMEVCLFYKGRWHLAARPIPAGGVFPVDTLTLGVVPGKELASFFGDPVLQSRLSGLGGAYAGPRRTYAHDSHPPPGSPLPTVKQLMFRDDKLGGGGVVYPNDLWRPLDQTWRLKPAGGAHRDEVILVARTAGAEGRAAAVNPGALVPLWLGELPKGGEAKGPELAGDMTQETYVRVYIPVKTQAERP